MPPAPAGAASASRISSSNGTPGANVSRAHCSEPAADSITPMACQLPGHGVAEDVHPGLRVGLVGGQGGEDDAGGAEHERDGPWPLDADAERRGGAVARACGDRNAGGGAARELGRFERARHPGLGHLERVQHGREKRRSATSNSSVPEASATSIARSPQSRSRT